MKSSTLLIWFIFSSSLLMVLTSWKHAKPLHFKHVEAIRISKIQKVCMKDYVRKRDYHIRKRSMDKAQVKINKLLAMNPILFDRDILSKENNQSNEISLSQNKVALARVIDVVNNISEDVVLNIKVHTDVEGSSEHNLKLSQSQADKLKVYIGKRSNILLLTAIGYGEEFPHMESDENLSNKRIEMSLKRVQR